MPKFEILKEWIKDEFKLENIDEEALLTALNQICGIQTDDIILNKSNTLKPSNFNKILLHMNENGFDEKLLTREEIEDQNLDLSNLYLDILSKIVLFKFDEQEMLDKINKRLTDLNVVGSFDKFDEGLLKEGKTISSLIGMNDENEITASQIKLPDYFQLDKLLDYSKAELVVLLQKIFLNDQSNPVSSSARIDVSSDHEKLVNENSLKNEVVDDANSSKNDEQESEEKIKEMLHELFEEIESSTNSNNFDYNVDELINEKNLALKTNEDLKKKLGEVEESLTDDTFNIKINELKTLIEKSKATLQDHTEQKITLTERIDALNKEIEMIKQDSDNLLPIEGHLTKTIVSEIGELNSQYKMITKTKNTLENEEKDLGEVFNTIKLTFQEKESLFQQKKIEITKLRERHTELLNKVKELEASKKQRNESISKLNESIEKLTESTIRNEKSIKQLEEEKSRIELEIKDLKETLNKLDQNTTELKDKQKELKDSESKLKEELKIKEKTLKENDVTDDKISLLKKSKEELSSIESSKKSMKKKLVDENRSIESKIRSIKQKIDELNLRELNKENKKLEKQLEAEKHVQNVILSLESESKELETKILDQQNINQIALKELEDLNLMYKELEESNDVLLAQKQASLVQRLQISN